MSKQITYNTIGSMVTLFFQWLILMLIPKMAGFSDAGIFAVALSICSIMNLIATMSLNTHQIANQYQNYSENDYFVCRLLTIILSFVLCIIVIIVMGYSLEQSLVIIGYMTYRNFIHFAYLHSATLQIKQHLDYVGKCMIFEGIVSFVSFILVYSLTKDLSLSTIIMALFGGGSFLISISLGYRRYFGAGYPMHCKFNSNVKKLLIMSIPLMIATTAPVVITALPKIILQQYWGNELVGIYSTISAPTIVIPTLIIGIFTPFIINFSNFSKKGDMKSIRLSYLKMIGLGVIFCAVALIISILFAEFFFKLLYGDYIVPYVHYFDILVIGIVIYSIGICGVTVLITKEQLKEAVGSTLIALAISAILFIVTIPEYGIDSATYGLVVAYSVFTVLISFCVLFIKPKVQDRI